MGLVGWFVGGGGFGGGGFVGGEAVGVESCTLKANAKAFINKNKKRVMNK